MAGSSIVGSLAAEADEKVNDQDLEYFRTIGCHSWILHAENFFGAETSCLVTMTVGWMIDERKQCYEKATRYTIEHFSTIIHYNKYESSGSSGISTNFLRYTYGFIIIRLVQKCGFNNIRPSFRCHSGVHINPLIFETILSSANALHVSSSSLKVPHIRLRDEKSTTQKMG
jgi:hypothetical protein